jgi:hypothetical protein
MRGVGELAQAKRVKPGAQGPSMESVSGEALLDAFLDDDAERLPQCVHVQDRCRVVIDVLDVPEARVQREVHVPARDGRAPVLDRLERAVR